MPLLTRGPDPIVYTPIGVIHTPFLARKNTPGQGVFSDGARGRVELFEPFRDGLADIDAFSHLVLLFHLDRADSYSLSTIPLLDDRPHGIFATRHHNRPNPIGFSIVRLDRVVGAVLEVSDVDIVRRKTRIPVVNVSDSLGEVSIEELVHWNPDVVVINSGSPADLAQRRPWKTINAAETGIQTSW